MSGINSVINSSAKNVDKSVNSTGLAIAAILDVTLNADWILF